MDSENNYDKISRFYNLISGSFEGRYRKKALRAFAAGPGESLLEIGFGSGHSLIEMAKDVGEKGHIAGIDNSSSMYRICMRKLRRRGLENRIHLKCQNILEASLEEDFFDGIFLSFTLETFPSEDIKLLMGKIRSWLKPGGRICILSMAESVQRTLLYKMYLWSHKTFPRIIDCRPINPEMILRDGGFSIKKSEHLKIYDLPVHIVLGE
ncbi:MAG: class I SAM-dependent methyltransferase [Spirochaetaceae bacterium]|nr:class I SAM-dependent methyltransferase [Spirochaetaceae bacterium]